MKKWLIYGPNYLININDILYLNIKNNNPWFFKKQRRKFYIIIKLKNNEKLLLTFKEQYLRDNLFKKISNFVLNR